MNLKGKHFLTTDDWAKDELDVVFQRAAELKEQFYNEEPHLGLPWKTLFMIFFEQSTRTRNSMSPGITSARRRLSGGRNQKYLAEDTLGSKK